MALKASSILVEQKPLVQPSLEAIAKALNKYLTRNFEYVKAEVVDCPDLTKEPFNLAGKGLGGTETIVEIGGVPYLMPLVKRDKVYEMKDINELVGVEPAFIIGAGAGPHVYVGKNSELVANLVVSNGKVKNLSRMAKLKDETVNDDFVVEILPETESRCALLANLYVSEGKPGQVLKVHCKKRTGKDDFVTAVRSALIEEFQKQPIGVGGAFLISGSKAKQHVMPDFSEVPLLSDEMVNTWLKFYQMNPPLVAVGTLVTNDPGLDLRLQHFHSFGMHSEAGHYHIDTNPDTVEYLAYLNTGASVVRLDRPEETHNIGRD